MTGHYDPDGLERAILDALRTHHQPEDYRGNGPPPARMLLPEAAAVAARAARAHLHRQEREASRG